MIDPTGLAPRAGKVAGHLLSIAGGCLEMATGNPVLAVDGFFRAALGVTNLASELANSGTIKENARLDAMPQNLGALVGQGTDLQTGNYVKNETGPAQKVGDYANDAATLIAGGTSLTKLAKNSEAIAPTVKALSAEIVGMTSGANDWADNLSGSTFNTEGTVDSTSVKTQETPMFENGDSDE